LALNVIGDLNSKRVIVCKIWIF